MPNVGGPRQKKRQLLMSVAQSQLLYAAPIWASALVFEVNVKELLKPQRKMAIRVSSAYCTVLTNAILVVSGLLPLHIKVFERTAMRVAQKAGSTPQSENELREESLSKWQNEWENSGTGEWMKRLIPGLRPWVSGSFGLVNFHITQFLTRHGCFEHALFICDRWWRRRRALEVATDTEFTPETVVNTMLESRAKWDTVCGYVVEVLKTREEEERQRQRHIHQIKFCIILVKDLCCGLKGNSRG
ncbi:uncharacterized protein LOC112597427 [Melanaphis sacchari]|uniref:uncharacterized protein LOC112597427 n=1 Tax=Melanaphis sacchari TaxID=742174 RepID=UPI000DC15469|nr:uncharacterized protein LOC112597427 [Melanaphis sacchari]